jgi:hypothetical protein
MSDSDAVDDGGRALDKESIRKKDRELLDKIRHASAFGGVLKDRTSISDLAMLAELLDLGFTADTIVLLPLVPVIELAWAEGGIAPAERQLLVSLARRRGVEDGSTADRQLREWMEARPSSEVFGKAGRLIAALLSSGALVTRGLTSEQLVSYCEEIASASGGLFGLPIRTVSTEERELLTRIAGDLETRKR